VAITAPTATLSPVLGDVRAHHTGDRRGHFDRDLVGFQAGDRLVGGTRSPGCLSHSPMVASETDSPRVGTLTSVDMVLFQSQRVVFASGEAIQRGLRGFFARTKE
jgi:hypothetical protein